MLDTTPSSSRSAHKMIVAGAAPIRASSTFPVSRHRRQVGACWSTWRTLRVWSPVEPIESYLRRLCHDDHTQDVAGCVAADPPRSVCENH